MSIRPLLMGNDLRELSPESLTILNNPAIIAISQDPLGSAAFLIRKDLNVKKDKYGVGETQMWSGSLSGGDQLVILFNAADEDVEMEASLAEIFYYQGPEGSAPHVQQSWHVYDLWANRMDLGTAQRVIDAKDDVEAARTILQDAKWYNVTKLSYKDGLRAGDERLLGKKVETIKAKGSLKRNVKRHSADVFRLRNAGEKVKQYLLAKDEL
jgi:alpha-galactosidase